MNYRQEEVLEARADSCTWILEHPSYLEWLEDNHGLLWIEGKPGSGKSTLMKRIFQVMCGEDSAPGWIRLSFFFHRRGVQLQHSPLGMFRTMLHQLLSQFPPARADFLSVCEEKRRFQGDNSREWDWREPELRKLLQSCLITSAKIRSIIILVDALDEAGEEAARSIVSYLHDVNEKLLQSEHKTSICFACRHYPIVRTHEGIQICVEDENFADILAYANVELRRRIHPRDEDSGSDKLNQLQDQICKNASGVFLWVTLVISTIAKQYNEGSSLDEILDGLRRAPSDLKAMYEHILELVGLTSRRQSLHLMQWICLAERPLSLTELRFALAMDDSAIHQYQQSARDSKGFVESDSRMKDLVVSLSGGLAEVRAHSKIIYGEQTIVKRVQFIHQSVNDFLLKDGLAWLDQNSAGNAIGRGHDRLTKSCVNYLKLEEVARAADSISLTKTEPWEMKSLEVDLPFIEYSTNSWFLHAEKAESLEVLQRDLIQKFESPTDQYFPNWVKLYTNGGLRAYNRSLLREGTSLMHVAAASNLKSVVASLLESGTPSEEKDAGGNTALHDAAYMGHSEIIHLLLDAGADVNARTNAQRTPLERAGAGGHTEVVRLLLKNGAEVNQETGQSGSALQSAAFEGRYVTVKLLLENRADIHAQGGYFGNALQAAAAARRNDATVELLLNRGADINAQGGKYGNALQAAVYRGSKALVELLLNQGADINKRDSQGRLAILLAMRKNKVETVKDLLSRGAIPDWTYTDQQGCSALHFAASGGSVEAIKLILTSGINIDINLPDTQGWTPLHWACRSGDTDAVQLLVNSGADLWNENLYSRTPLDVATFCGKSNVATMLSRLQLPAGKEITQKTTSPGIMIYILCSSCDQVSLSSPLIFPC